MKLRELSVIKRGILAVVAALVALGLAACGSGSSSSPNSLEELKQSGVLNVGTEGTYAPFSFHDPQTGELTGFDVDVAKAVAEQLGVEAKFFENEWDALFPGLQADRYQVVANQVSVTAERQKLYALSTPYSISRGVIVTKSSDNSVKSLADVKGKKSAQSSTSNWAKVARDAGAEVVTVEGFTQAVTLVKQGRVDLTINDSLVAADYFKSTNDSEVKIAAELPNTFDSLSALALKKDSPLLPGINNALKQLAENGKLKEISEKWFGKDVTK